MMFSNKILHIATGAIHYGTLYNFFCCRNKKNAHLIE